MADLSSKPLVNISPGEKSAQNGATPANWAATLISALGLKDLKMEKMIPAVVTEYDRTKNMATVQPQVMLLDVSDNSRMRNPIGQVPVLALGGGGFFVNFPLKKGDFGWILAADRDISQFVQNLQAAAPNTLRRHSFSDSWFIPDVLRQYVINGSDANNMVISSTDGTNRISIGEGVINVISSGVLNITAPTQANITTPLAVFSQNVQVDGTLTVAGAAAMNGGFTAANGQSCTLPSSTTIAGVIVINHGHDQNGTSGRTSGGMIS